MIDERLQVEQAEIFQRVNRRIDWILESDHQDDKEQQ